MGEITELSFGSIKCEIQMGKSGSQVDRSTKISGKSQARDTNTNSWEERDSAITQPTTWFGYRGSLCNNDIDMNHLHKFMT